jgi:hypothetical protein
MRSFLLLILLLLGVACTPKDKATTEAALNESSCKGEWTTSDQYGVNKRYNEFWNESMKACLKENLPLTQWEESVRTRSQHAITCTPQTTIPTVRLKSANNFYTYRNDRIFIELDSSTGIYKKLEIGESQNNEEEFIREVGCFYVRQDQETELWGAKDYGLQILLDSELGASSNIFHPMQVFRILNMGGNWEMTRFDDTADWGFTFCPDSSTPWGFCNLRRNGNQMFEPDGLTVSQMNDLRDEAILIRTEFNFIEIGQTDFEGAWESAVNSTTEYTGSWKYLVMGFPDIPIYIDRDWRAYIRGERPMMPETDSIRIRPICYEGMREEVTGGVTVRVYGEVCYINGQYVFTGN